MPRRFTAIGKGGRFPNGSFDGGFSFKLSNNVYKHLKLGREKEDQALTPKNEDIVRSIPDVVKCPQTPTKLEKNMMRVVSEYINRTLVSLSWLAAEGSTISVRRCRETYVEAWVLCEGEMFRAFVMAKVPKNLIQHRIS